MTNTMENIEREGLKQGTYSVTLKGSTGSGYRDTTLSNIQVLKERNTHIPTIILHK